MAIPVPDTFAELTVEWFDAALREGGQLDVGVADITVVPLDPSKGLFGDLASIQVIYGRGQGPASFVIKLPASNPENRAIGALLGAYAREVAFYRHVAPVATGMRLPRCYYAGADDSQGRWAVIIDEIEADPFDYFAGATLPMAQAAIDALADFHRAWWQSPTRFEWMPGLDQGDLGHLQSFWVDTLPVFVTRYQDQLPGPTAEWVLRFAPGLSDWARQAAAEPLTMVHSDCRVDNMLFQGNEVTLIDWQTAMRAPAAMDVTCFITTSLSIEDRRQHETELIDRYLTRLTADGLVVDRAWFMRSYDENILWWMGQFGHNLAHLDPGSDFVQRALNTMINRVYQTGLDRGVDYLL